MKINRPDFVRRERTVVMPAVHDVAALRNLRGIFRNRMHAGQMLGELLKADYGADEWVMAIPSGGVPVGIEVAKALNCRFDLVIVRKLRIPGNKEAGFGAMTLRGALFLNEELVGRLALTEDEIESEAETVRKELSLRDRLFRSAKPLPDISGRNVIIVDDGMASGYTLMAAARLMRQRNAGRVIAAASTAPASTIDRIKKEVDEIYCVNIRETVRFAVAEAYMHWRDLSDKEVIDMLNREKPQGLY